MLTITPLAALTDNYIWIIEQNPSEVVVVDPGDARVVLDWLHKENKKISAILITHRHHDHTGGVAELTRHYKVPVYGPDSPQVPCITHKLYDGDHLSLFDGYSTTILKTPGHTHDHLVYYIHSNDNASHQLFCGDTLFSAGCGRIFPDGSAQLLFQSLQRLKALPQETVIYCTHEYTLANTEFALAVEPDNQALQRRRTQAQHEAITLPTTLSQELEFNPFLRTDKENIIQAVCAKVGKSIGDEESIFVELRAWKDQF